MVDGIPGSLMQPNQRLQLTDFGEDWVAKNLEKYVVSWLWDLAKSVVCEP
jgi:hypothetical protein